MKKIVPSALVLALLLTGCGADRGIFTNYRAIEELQTVHTLGLDDADGVTVTAAVSKSGESGPSAILRGSGESIPLALRDLQDHTQRGRLFFAHARYVLLGRGLAEQGFDALLDYTARDTLTRMGAALLVLRDDSASAALAAIGDGDAVAAMLDAVRRETLDRGGCRVADLRSAAVALSEYGAALVGALSAADAGDSLLSEGPALTLVPDGYAVVKDAAVIAWLEGRDAETAGFLAGHPGRVRREFSVPGGGSVTLEVRCNGADFHCALENGTPSVDVTLALSAVIAAVAEVDAPLTEGGVPEALCRALEQQVTEDALRVLAASRDLDADFLSLARRWRLRGTLPPDGWLPETGFRVRAEAVLDHSSDLGEPLTTGGAL